MWESKTPHPPVAEDLPPAPEALVAGQEQRTPLVAPADELEEEVGAVAVEGKYPISSTMSRRDGVELELLVQPALGSCLGEGGDKSGGRGEKPRVAVLDGLEAQADGQVGLPDTGRAEDDEVLPCSTKWQLARVWTCFLSSEGW
jgi:hypothetical protein